MIVVLGLLYDLIRQQTITIQAITESLQRVDARFDKVNIRLEHLEFNRWSNMDMSGIR